MLMVVKLWTSTEDDMNRHKTQLHMHIQHDWAPAHISVDVRQVREWQISCGDPQNWQLRSPNSCTFLSMRLYGKYGVSMQSKQKTETS